MTIFKVIINDDLTDQEAELVNHYWHHNGYEKIQFIYPKYALKAKAEKIGVKKLDSFIQKKSYVFFIGEGGKCFDCQLPITASKRTVVNMILSQAKHKRLCEKCLLANTTKILKPKLEHLNMLIENNLGIVYSSEYNSLSYIEKLYIYTILNMCKVNKSGQLKQIKLQGFIQKEWGEESYIIKSLINKRFILKIDSGDFIHNAINSIRCTMKDARGLVDKEIIQTYKSLIKKIPVNGVYLKLPNCFDNYEEYENQVLKHILDRKICEEDVYFIESWLHSVALSKLIYLAEFAKCKYNNIRIDYDVELDSVYKSMLKTLSIDECNLIITRAMYVASREIYFANNPTSFFKYIRRDKIFYYILKKTIDFYKTSGINYEYKQDVDMILNISDIELFIDSYIAMNHIKWNYFNLRDILAIIVNSVKVIAQIEN
ncbi:hypothetical protein [Acinetobacter pittii]|uniref:hypothetical protein n=1 Tax=Acinetobacter pittii TaxID=48296 RepID=UPI00062A617A|nr:hypothetical protein [Acinetobacter pittii]TGU85405.1 hypothetical protein YA64_017200 [Acinetobacter pittii]